METETFAGKTVSRTFNEFEDFNVGDIVRLKSGGPNMTVDATGSSRIVCIWFETAILPDGTPSPLGNTTIYRHDFHQGALEKVAAEKSES